MAYILVLFLFLFVLNLRGRIEKLERSISGAALPVAPLVPQAGLSGNAVSGVTPPVSAAISSELPVSPQITAPVQPIKEAQANIIDWIQRDWLLKLGGLLVLIAFGWFVSYAFINNWIGPMGRITIGLLAGSCLLGFGWLRMRTFIHQGSVFLIVGSTTVLLTLYAARSLYDFFTPLVALMVMLLSIVVVVLASISYQNRVLAIASMVLAGFAPLLTDAPQTDGVELFSYLMVVLVGTLWVVYVTKWRELSLYALLLVALHSVPYFMGAFSSQQDLLLLFAFGFTALIFLTNIVSLVKNIALPSSAEAMVIIGNGLFLIAWILTAGQKEWQSLLLTAWMIVFAGASFMAMRISKKTEIFYAHGLTAVVMLVAATAAELDGSALTLAYIAESLLVAFVVALFSRNMETAMKASLVVIGPMFLAVQSYFSSSWYREAFHSDFAVLLFMACGLMVLGLGFRRFLSPTGTPFYRQLSNFYMIAGSVYFYMLLWKALHAGQATSFGLSSMSTMICYLVYTSIGIVCYFQGHKLLRKSLRLYGGILVLVVIARLVLVDVWRMELSGRIITFFLLGALLMGTAFVQSKKKE